jgi:hypothetical protein
MVSGFKFQVLKYIVKVMLEINGFELMFKKNMGICKM